MPPTAPYVRVRGNNLSVLLAAASFSESSAGANAIGVPKDEFERVMLGGPTSARFIAGAVLAVSAPIAHLFELAQEA